MKKSKVTYYEVDQEDANRRIDNYLLAKLKGLPRSRLYNLMRKGEIRVNKKRVKPADRLQAGDEVRVAPIMLAPPKEAATPGDSLIKRLQASILHEDEKFLVINKPAGLAVHGGTGLRIGLIEALRAMYPELKQLELVHRLDRGTSGCLMVAKKMSALRDLQQLMREGKVDKRYQTLTLGHWKKDKNIVDLPLKKNTLQSGERMVRVDYEEGKASKTIFYQKDRFDASSLIEAKLITGRTHQIRVHAAQSGHPVAGDEKYGDKAFNKLMKQRGLKRLFLHARELSFVLPWSGERFKVMAELPEELEDVLNGLRC
jgi:23S rRNA pseudouridine955/2504/2580 synthase